MEFIAPHLQAVHYILLVKLECYRKIKTHSAKLPFTISVLLRHSVRSREQELLCNSFPLCSLQPTQNSVVEPSLEFTPRSQTFAFGTLSLSANSVRYPEFTLFIPCVNSSVLTSQETWHLVTFLSAEWSPAIFFRFWVEWATKLRNELQNSSCFRKRNSWE